MITYNTCYVYKSCLLVSRHIYATYVAILVKYTNWEDGYLIFDWTGLINLIWLDKPDTLVIGRADLFTFDLLVHSSHGWCINVSHHVHNRFELAWRFWFNSMFCCCTDFHELALKIFDGCFGILSGSMFEFQIRSRCNRNC